MTVIKFPGRTYSAKLFKAGNMQVAGTLDGYLDVAFPDLTYQLTLEDALGLVKALNASIADVRENCLYDKDALLEPPQRDT